MRIFINQNLSTLRNVQPNLAGTKAIQTVKTSKNPSINVSVIFPKVEEISETKTKNTKISCARNYQSFKVIDRWQRERFLSKIRIDNLFINSILSYKYDLFL